MCSYFVMAAGKDVPSLDESLAAAADFALVGHFVSK
jgi:hypothetical protein